MPGRTPPEAFEAFIEPIRRALSCLGPAKITLSQHGRQVGDTRAWTLNNGLGLAMRGGWHLDATMHYEIIPTQDTSAWRVTTRAYRYRVACADAELVRMHWHPSGNSPHTLPHLHIPALAAATHHLPVTRLTFEDAIEWAISLGAPPAREDWRDVLGETRALHIEHRSWHVSPRETSR
ncbi:hypothetical protein GXB85_04775 [Cellulomonas sp. APG4]|uniref:hypothetical protein n=1 Tax=Cellulomonas sp. APG4 TaxID=1538656 RepID=UPI00137B5437|nr:hypothetical protein [Cellulomonas sp. APG4]NCT90268.1 hypothetical protein [Cellulomonas sp. APG4]